jgi:3-hydroxyisobutyrate dehydrogenase
MEKSGPDRLAPSEMSGEGTRIAILGAGGMGSAVARRLLDLGFDVAVWNRTGERTSPLIEAGASGYASIAEAVKGRETIFTFVSDREALEAVAFAPGGLVESTRSGQTIVEMSTLGVHGIEFIARELPDGVALIEAPVLGSRAEAEMGKLTILVGGEAAATAAADHVLRALGTPVFIGPLGKAAGAKLVANHALFGALLTFAEAVALGDRVGLPRELTFDVLMRTPLAEQSAKRRPAMEDGSYPPRFPLRLALKDARLIDQAAEGTLPLARAVEAWLRTAEAEGNGSLDYTAVIETVVDQTRAPQR